MKSWGLMRVGAAFAAFTLLTFFYITTEGPFRPFQPYITMQLSDESEPDWNSFLVYGPNCRIRKTDPFDETIKEYLAPTNPVICSTLEPLSKIQERNGSNILVIEQGLINKYKLYGSHRIECCYSVISRISQTLHNYTTQADHQYKVSSCDKFNKEVILKNTTEFLLVKCQSIPKKLKKGKYVYENGHALAPLTPKIAEKIKKIKNSQIWEDIPKNISDEKLSVLIIGIDSVSRSSLRRTMPSTLRFFQSNKWFELNGYNKIGDNTFPNLMAILAGRTVSQLKKDCHPDSGSIMDNCPIIWKEFRSRGYVTVYAEDVPVLATFNYKTTGFVEQPTDYYMRPFMLASHASLPVKNKDSLPICVGAASVADHIFNYAKSFANTFKNHPFFGLFWLNSFTHNNVNSPAALDLRLFQLLEQLQNIGTYNNTIVIVLSDHGIRFGKIRKTFLGFLEERLPFIFINVPKIILEKYPHLHKSMLTNQRRLTSPYDVHVTLRHILGKEGDPPRACEKCRTLFEEVPNNRSCDEAGVGPDWCTCPNFMKVEKTDEMAQKVGGFLYHRVLNRTKELMLAEKAKPSLCIHREFDDIIRIYENKLHTVSNGIANNPVFVVVIQTRPFAMFEATIRVNQTTVGNQFQVLGFISRLDSYLNTTKCVQSKMLQFYCHCFDATI